MLSQPQGTPHFPHGDKGLAHPEGFSEADYVQDGLQPTSPDDDDLKRKEKDRKQDSVRAEVGFEPWSSWEYST